MGHSLPQKPSSLLGYVSPQRFSLLSVTKIFPPWKINTGLLALHRVDLMSWPGAVECLTICGESGSQEKEGDGETVRALSRAERDAVPASSAAGSVVGPLPRFLPFLEPARRSWGCSQRGLSRACVLAPLLPQAFSWAASLWGPRCPCPASRNGAVVWEFSWRSAAAVRPALHHGGSPCLPCLLSPHP